MNSFGFTEIISIIPWWVSKYFLLGARNLFFKSDYNHMYTGDGAHSDSYIQECAKDETSHSIHFTNSYNKYFLFDLTHCTHLVPRFAPGYLSHWVLRLRWIMIIASHNYLKYSIHTHISYAILVI